MARFLKEDLSSIWDDKFNERSYVLQDMVNEIYTLDLRAIVRYRRELIEVGTTERGNSSVPIVLTRGFRLQLML